MKAVKPVLNQLFYLTEHFSRAVRLMNQVIPSLKRFKLIIRFLLIGFCVL